MWRLTSGCHLQIWQMVWVKPFSRYFSLCSLFIVFFSFHFDFEFTFLSLCQTEIVPGVCSPTFLANKLFSDESGSFMFVCLFTGGGHSCQCTLSCSRWLSICGKATQCFFLATSWVLLSCPQGQHIKPMGAPVTETPQSYINRSSAWKPLVYSSWYSVYFLLCWRLSVLASMLTFHYCLLWPWEVFNF